MTTATRPELISPLPVGASPSVRVTSVDALRGLVMFTMIFVNDLSGSSVPAWMRHYHGKNGMTFVDLVFPAFLFIMGMSIPLAFGSRRARGEPRWMILVHVVARTLSLLLVGILMVNSESPPSSERMRWSGTLWTVLMFLSAILAFCSIAPRTKESQGNSAWRRLTFTVRILGFVGLILLAFTYQSDSGRRIITLRPFSIHTEWYGILGLIGWAYLMASIVVLVFGTHRTALLGCTVLLFCLYPADRTGMFDGLWISRHIGIGEALGSQAAIAAAGALLGTILLTPETATSATRSRFTLLFVAGFSAAAVLAYGLWGINKNSATPSWCLWACAITAALWLIFYFVADVFQFRIVTQPLRVAGENVLLAYLLSEMVESSLQMVHLSGWYQRLAEPNLSHSITRSAGCAVAILSLTALLNRLGFKSGGSRRVVKARDRAG